jgi:hypothetical protein
MNSFRTTSKSAQTDRKNLLQALEVLGTKHLPAALGDEHQIGVKEINDVPALAYFHALTNT